MWYRMSKRLPKRMSRYIRSEHPERPGAGERRIEFLRLAEDPMPGPLVSPRTGGVSHAVHYLYHAHKTTNGELIRELSIEAEIP